MKCANVRNISKMTVLNHAGTTAAATATAVIAATAFSAAAFLLLLLLVPHLLILLILDRWTDRRTSWLVCERWTIVLWPRT